MICKYYNCDFLNDVYCYATSVPETENDVFGSVPMSDVTLHVPASAIDAYMETEPWSGFGNIVALDDDEPVIADKNCIDGIYYNFDEETLTAEVTYKRNEWGGNEPVYSGDIVIPESVVYNGDTYSVTAIDYGAFSGCNDLTSVVIPNSVTSIGGWAFAYCWNLTSVNLSNSITSISYDAFYGCI